MGLRALRTRRLKAGAASLVITMVTIAGCSGGSTMLPSSQNADTLPNEPAKTGTVQLTVQIPRKAPVQNLARVRPAYTSPSTVSMVVSTDEARKAFNLLATSPGCSRSKSTGDVDCAETVALSAGAQTIRITLYDRAKGTGAALSSASTNVKIVAGKTTKLSIVTDGIPASAVVELGKPATSSHQIPQGTATSVPVTVNAYDAKGNLIVPPGPYATAVTLSDSDKSGATKLSKTSVTAPNTDVSVKYDGSSSFASASITPSIGHVTQDAGAATLSVVATIVEYSIPRPPSTQRSTFPNAIVEGRDRALWFTQSSASEIGRITTGGTITEYSAPEGSGITLGADGAFWYPETGAPVPVRVTTGGTVTEYSIPSSSVPGGFNAFITGPDGALWAPANTAGLIARITTTGALTPYPLPSPTSNPSYYYTNDPNSVTVGPDKALWFSANDEQIDAGCDCNETNNYYIGRMTTAGTVTAQYPMPNDADGYYGMTTGPDGNLWFSSGTAVDRMTTDGTITAFPISTGNSVTAITTGPDKSIWFAECGNPFDSPSDTDYVVGHLTIAQTASKQTVTITEYSGPSPTSSANSIVAGPDDALWFTDPFQGAIGRVPVAISASNAGRRRQVRGQTVVVHGRFTR